ncbi:MAG: TonB-dependent receptor [Sphingobium sp.]|nr:TonB-dependent receptor [Sphingobium sp.]
MAFALAHPAYAAPSADAPQAAGNSGNREAPSAEGDIIVTAMKVNERLQDVPASVSVVGATELTKAGVVRFSDYATRVPGLSLTTGRTGTAQVTLRGITTGAAQPGSTTGYYIDEAPVGSVNAYTGGSSITPDLDPSDLAQIEVLKGPQGTLYGAGAVGGLLKFTTATPNFDDFEGRASAGLTSAHKGEMGFSVRGMVNIPLAPGQLVLRVSGLYRKDPGFIDNVNPLIGKKNDNTARVRGGRAVLAMRLGPDVTLNVSAIGQDTTSDAGNAVDVDAATLKPIYGDLKQNKYVRERGYLRLRLYNATLKADLSSNLDLVSSTTYQRIYFKEIGDGTRSYGAALGPFLGVGSSLGVRINTIKRTERWSEEARLSATGLFDGLLDLQGGFYWTKEDDINRIPGMDTFLTTTGATLPLPQLAIASIDSSYEEYSGFANARVYLGSKFDVLGGIRYSHDKQAYLQDYQGQVVGPRLIVLGTESANITTWLVSPRFRMSDTLMIYGRVGTGYRPGGPNPAPPVGGIPLTFDPDKLIQYEVGIKTSTADRKLSLDAALFYTDWKHVQIQTSGGGFNYLVNGGRARSQGGELSLRYQPTRAFTLGANVGYTDAKLTSDAPAAGGLDGDRLPYVPRVSGALTADYSMELSGSTTLTLGATANYISNRTSDYANRFPKKLEGYATFDLRAGIGNDAWTLSAFVKNLTDKRAIIVAGTQGLAPSNTPGAFYSAAVNQPRVIGAEAAIRF